MVPQLLLADCARGVDLVSKDEEGDFAELLNREESVQFSLGFRESFKVGTVNKEDNGINLREVVAPESASWVGHSMMSLSKIYTAKKPTLLMSSKIISVEFDIANGQFFGG